MISLGNKIIYFVIMAILISSSIEENNYKTAFFGAGCFWCVEAVFEELNGVIEVVSGYSGGSKETANYNSVCSGDSDHAEICQITYNPNIISFEILLEVFFLAHDPTTINKQGNDIGSQYRSIIFWNTDNERKLANQHINFLEESGVYDNVVTELVPFHKFYKAEINHQNYFTLNTNQPYCTFIIRPKLNKLRNKLKKHY
jgi:peptide-methionine (S)-S-oxide reductase